MPELPEAETIKLGLNPRLSGKRIESVDVVRPDVLKVPPPEFMSGVAGHQIQEVIRRGKKVVLVLDQEAFLVVSLGMTGRLLSGEEGQDPTGSNHPALRFHLDGRRTLVFDDVRRFGSVEYLTDDQWRRISTAMGPEPLSRAFSSAAIAPQLRKSRTPVRSWLLDQRCVAGVGNIYANEALYRSRVHPRRPANTLSQAETRSMVRHLRGILREAIAASGTTLRDYRTSEGAPGGYQVRLDAYGRDGEPCRRCTTPIERTVFSNRSAFFCPQCQSDTSP